MEQISKLKSINAYHFVLESKIARHLIKINAIIFAESFKDADQFFYWKILSEFSPKEYVQIVSKATWENCTQEAIPQEECIFARRGLIFFGATCDDVAIRSLELPRPWEDNKNWHKGAKLTLQKVAFPLMTVLYLTLLTWFLYTLGLF